MHVYCHATTKAMDQKEWTNWQENDSISIKLRNMDVSIGSKAIMTALNFRNMDVDGMLIAHVVVQHLREVLTKVLL